MDSPAFEPLELAVRAEKTSLHRYLELATQVPDPAVKNMMVRLALDEFSHMELLEGQRATLQESGNWSPSAVPESLIEKVVPALKDVSRRLRAGSGANALEALRAALDAEAKARDSYLEMSRQATDRDVAEMFRRLSEMEQAHADLLQAEIDSIEDNGFWFSTREFTLEAER